MTSPPPAAFGAPRVPGLPRRARARARRKRAAQCGIRYEIDGRDSGAPRRPVRALATGRRSGSTSRQTPNGRSSDRTARLHSTAGCCEEKFRRAVRGRRASRSDGAHGLCRVRDGRGVPGARGSRRHRARRLARRGAAGERARAASRLRARSPSSATPRRSRFATRSVDVVYVHDGLHHLDDPLAGLAEMARVARSAVCVSEPARAGITALAVRAGLALEREEAGNRVGRLDAEAVRPSFANEVSPSARAAGTRCTTGTSRGVSCGSLAPWPSCGRDGLIQGGERGRRRSRQQARGRGGPSGSRIVTRGKYAPFATNRVSSVGLYNTTTVLGGVRKSLRRTPHRSHRSERPTAGTGPGRLRVTFSSPHLCCISPAALRPPDAIAYREIAARSPHRVFIPSRECGRRPLRKPARCRSGAFVSRILVWSPNYAPELIGIPPLVTDACNWLAARRHQVDVVTALPNYPERRIHPGYRGKIWLSERRGDVGLHRSWLRARPRERFVDKALYELSFAALSTPAAIRRIARADVVLCVVPCLSAAAGSTVLVRAARASGRRVRLVLWVQDLVLRAASSLDDLGPGACRLIGLAGGVEKAVSVPPTVWSYAARFSPSTRSGSASSPSGSK